MLDTLPTRFCPDATTKPKGLKWEYQGAAANGGGPSQLQSARLVAAVAELVRPHSSFMKKLVSISLVTLALMCPTVHIKAQGIIYRFPEPTCRCITRGLPEFDRGRSGCLFQRQRNGGGCEFCYRNPCIAHGQLSWPDGS